jgi:peptidylprolyl isomerase/FKBP-type peptidyl-prolyl cis-trans isomerase FklB
MKKYLGIILAALLITSCGKDNENPIAEAWKRQNEQAFNDIAKNPDFTELKISGGYTEPIYYRIIQKGEGKRIYFNSQVEVYYKGWFVATNSDLNIKAGDVFEKRQFDDGITSKFAVNEVVAGWGIALQHMVEGDKWEIWIPYQLGYGEAGKGNISGYSTLAFEIEVIKAFNPNEF